MISGEKKQGDLLGPNDPSGLEQASLQTSKYESDDDILGQQDVDPALNMKMHLVNNAIDEIGWTGYHWKLFVLNGFGYAVDSLVLLLQGVIATPAYTEFGEVGYSAGLTVAVYVGMLVGALFWGFGADVIGRRTAFNVSLFICSVATIVAGAAPNWASLGFFIAVLGFGAGGNLVLDTAVFLEYLPGSKQWTLSLLAMWWGIGQTVTGAIAWGFLVPERYNCKDVASCTYQNNMGWRYVMYTAGALVLTMSLARVTVVRLKETPKYLLGMREEAKLVENLQELATKYNRPCSLTLEKLQACGTIRSSGTAKRFSFRETSQHISGLFATKKLALSTSMIWLSWTLIGLAYPLFYVFLNKYLASRGVGATDPFIVWRDYTLTNISGIFGPILAGFLCNLRILGRKYTMLIGALLTMAFFFAYTAVKTADQNVAFSCTIGFCLNIYYGTLYAYTPEVLPSAHRGTGNGISVACNRIMGIISAVVSTTADTSTSVPIYICAALFAALGGIAAVFPFEPYGKRSS